jgi:hypothetical protein
MPANKSLIKAALLFICTNQQAKQGRMVRFWAKNNFAVSLSLEEELKFAEAIREILKHPLVLENFSVKEIENQVQDIISRTMQLPRLQRKANIESEIIRLFASLSRQIKDYQFIIPISNLKINRKIKIGNVNFKIFTQYQLQKWTKTLRDLIKGNPNYTNEQKKKIVNSTIERHFSPLQNVTCAEIKVKARTKRASEIALNKVNEALDIIKLFCLIDRGPYGSNVGISGEILNSSTRSVLQREIPHGSINTTLEKVGPLFPLEIDDKLVKMMYKYGLNKLNKVLLKKKRSWVERKLFRAIYWFARIFDTPLKKLDDQKILVKRGLSRSISKEEIVEYGRINERFVKAIVALESLFILDQGEPIQNNIAERAAFILANECQKRRQVKRYIKRMYKLRSHVVHQGFTYVSMGELTELISLVRSAIIAFLLKKDRVRMKTNVGIKVGIKTKDDFYTYFENKKFS